MAHIHATGFYMVGETKGMLSGSSAGIAYLESVMRTPGYMVGVIEPEIVKYGLLYNWYVVNDVRNICADDWHVPTKVEVDTLNTFLGGASIAGGKLKETGYAYWYTPNTGATNEVGFNARGSGWRFTTTGAYEFLLQKQYFWTSTINDSTTSYDYGFEYNFLDNIVSWGANSNGLNLRLIKDTTTLAHGQTGTYTGNDGTIYPTICIGTQEWVACNIAETQYNNGDPILEVTDNDEWVALTTGAMCAYNNNWANVYNNGCVGRLTVQGRIYYASTINGVTVVGGTLFAHTYISGHLEPAYAIRYGLLYNWYVVNDVRNICAAGWHVPVHIEWNTLITYLGGYLGGAGGKLKESGFIYWDNPNSGATNEVGFNGRGSSYRNSSGNFSVIKQQAFLMSSDNYVDDAYYYLVLDYMYSYALMWYAVPASEMKKYGQAIRPVKDSTTLTHGQRGTYIGNDGHVYNTICIGTQEWLAENFAETKYRDGSFIPEVIDNASWAALLTGGMCAYYNDWNNVFESFYRQTVFGRLKPTFFSTSAGVALVSGRLNRMRGIADGVATVSGTLTGI